MAPATTETVETTNPLAERIDSEAAVPDAEAVTTDEATDTDTDAGKPGNAEAAKYRRRLREAEALAAAELAQPGDLFAFGAELADVLDDDGFVDADKVAALTMQLTIDRPGLRAVRNAWPDMGQGHRGAVSTGSGISWSDALTAARY